MIPDLVDGERYFREADLPPASGEDCARAPAKAGKVLAAPAGQIGSPAWSAAIEPVRR